MLIRWNIYPLTIADQRFHLEYSEHLLNTIQPGDAPVLYWSQAPSDMLVLGFSQKQHTLNQDVLAREPLPVYHRRAGGTAVLVGPHLLDLDVILPPDHPFALKDIVESYHWFGAAWVQALEELGVSTRIVPPDEAHAQAARRKQSEHSVYEQLMQRACYGTLSPYEVVAGQRKVVGLCMIRRRCGTLLQAGIVLHWDSSRLARLLGHTPDEQALLQTGLSTRVVGLDSLAARVISSEEVIRAFERVVCSDLGASLMPAQPSPHPC